MTTKYTIDMRILAIVFMLIDHFGAVFYPSSIIYRLIGRLSFPLFAWGIAQGARNTGDWHKYAIRLFILALVSQYPYYLFTQLIPASVASTNVIFTLLLGLLAIQNYKSNHTLLVKYFIYASIFLVSFYLNSDYQFVGVLSVLISFVYMYNFPALITLQFLLFSSHLIIFWITGSTASFTNLTVFAPLLAPFAFLLTLFPKKHDAPSGASPVTRYLLYLIYPLQFLIIYWIKLYVA